MQERKFEELEDRASHAEKADVFEQLKARSRVIDEIEKMKAEGKALELSEEEENMLRSFRKFKSRMRKDGEVFKWQTIRPTGVTIANQDEGVIVHPQEVL